MRYFRPRPGLTVWLLLFSATAFLASGAALATVPVTNYVVVNPIDVCDSSGKNCAPFGMSCAINNQGGYVCTTFNVPSAATPSTPIGFVDMTTNPATNMPNNVNITRAIWLQSGIDVVFLPLQQYNSPANVDPWCPSVTSCFFSYPTTDYRTLHVVDLKCFDGVTKSTSPDFQALTKHAICAEDMGPPAGITAIPNSNPPLPPSPPPPLASTLPNLTLPNAIDMFFVNNFVGSGLVYGFAWINGNGIAIASSTFVPPVLGATPRFDTLAHEIGHNLNLDHTTFGNLDPASTTGAGLADNVMTAGDSRTIPSQSGCSTPSPTSLEGGALYDLDTGQCGTLIPRAPIADQLILPTKKTTTTVQQTEALLSGFMVPTANVPATATAGGGAAATTTATTTTTTATTAASTSGPITFTVTYPKFNVSGGRSKDAFIITLVVALPEGFSFGTTPFMQIGTTPTVVSHELLNGDNGKGNIHCLKPISGAPSIRCQEIDFLVTEPVPNTFVGSFTTNTTFSFTSDILDNSLNLATLAELTKACTTPAPLQCLNLTYVFGDLFATTTFFGAPVNGVSTGNSQSPDPTVPSAIVNAAEFPSVANLMPPPTYAGFPLNGGIVPCTPTNNSTSCPSGTLPQTGD